MSDRRKRSRCVLEAFGQGNLDIYDEAIAPDFVDHDAQNPYAEVLRGPQLMRSVTVMYRWAFPDLKVTIDDQYQDGDIVITRATVTGTQTGGLPGLPATGRRFSVGAVQIDRYEGDKIAEGWRYWDTLGMLQQLDAVARPRGPAI